jgi:hypothetical protein
MLCHAQLYFCFSLEYIFSKEGRNYNPCGVNLMLYETFWVEITGDKKFQIWRDLRNLGT